MTNPKYLEMDEVLKRLKLALDQHQSFSLIRIGDGENLVLAQDTVWPMEKVLQERWAVKANLGQKGLFLPNTELRDAVAEAVSKASITGILPYDDESIKAPSYMKRELTDQVFAHYALSPADLPRLPESVFGWDTRFLGHAEKSTHSAGHPDGR